MARISFKGKVRGMYNVEGTKVYDYIQIPELSCQHCDMAAFRQHPKYGAYANSDLFKNILRGIRQNVFGNYQHLKLHAIPDGVTVDASGFLAVVSFEV